MKQFVHTVKDPLGIHARPAGQIVKLAKEYGGTQIQISREDKSVSAAGLMKLMGLAVKQGDVLTVTAEGPDEVEAIIAMQKFFQNNL